jgi:hypothetical protein
MLFGMVNTRVAFQNMINDILRDLIDQGIVVYIDNILNFSAKEKEYQHLVMEVLQCIAH